MEQLNDFTTNYTKEEVLPYYEAYCAEWDKQSARIEASGAFETIEPKETFHTFMCVVQNNKQHWNIRRRTPSDVAKEYVRDLITNIDDATQSWNALNNAFSRLSLNQIDKVVQEHENSWSKTNWERAQFDPEDLEEAYRDFIVLRSIWEKYIGNPNYKSAMIYLFWIATGDNKLVHALYSPGDENNDNTLF